MPYLIRAPGRPASEERERQPRRGGQARDRGRTPQLWGGRWRTPLRERRSPRRPTDHRRPRRRLCLRPACGEGPDVLDCRPNISSCRPTLDARSSSCRHSP